MPTTKEDLPARSGARRRRSSAPTRRAWTARMSSTTARSVPTGSRTRRSSRSPRSAVIIGSSRLADATSRVGVPWEAPELVGLLARGHERECVTMSEVERAAEDLGLDDDQLQALHERLRAEHIDVRDDCGHEAAPPTEITPGELAVHTADALKQFLNEASGDPLPGGTDELERGNPNQR